MNDINLLPTFTGYLYSFCYSVQPTQLYLCVEHSEPFTARIYDQEFKGIAGFNYWPICADKKINVVCDKKVFNLYLCYCPTKPRQFY